MQKLEKRIVVIFIVTLFLLSSFPLFNTNASLVSNAGYANATAYSNTNSLLRLVNGTLIATYAKTTAVYISKSYNNGTSWTETLVTAGIQSPADAQLLADSFGVLYCFYWYSSGGQGYVVYKTSSDNGATWGSANTVTYGTTQDNFKVVIDSNNKFHAVINTGGAQYGGYLYYWSKPYGGTWSSQQLYQWSNYPNIAVDKNNGVHIVWEDYYSNWLLDYIYSPDGLKWDSQRTVFYNYQSGPTPYLYYSSVAVDSQLRVHVMWYAVYGVQTDCKIYYRNSTNFGLTWGPLMMMQAPLKGVNGVSLSTDASDNVYATWSDYADGTSQKHIFSSVKLSNSTVWRSPDSTLFNDYLAVAHTTSPNITIYKRNGDVLSKLADSVVLPNGTGKAVSWSSDGTYLAVAQDTNPYIRIYKRSGDTLTNLSNPDVLPTGVANGVAWSYNNQYLAVAHNTTPYVTIYKRNNDSFTKVSDPGTLPAGNGYGIAWSYDNVYLAVAHDTSPFVTIYNRSGDTFTKVTNPATLPTGIGHGVAFSVDSLYLAVAHEVSPYVTIYKRTTGTDTFVKLSNPGTLPTGIGRGVSFSYDTEYLAVAHDTSPYVTVYYRPQGQDNSNQISDTFSKLGNPGTLPTGNGRGVSWSYDTTYLAVTHLTSPYVTVYKRANYGSSATLTKLSNPGTLPTGNGNGIAWTQPFVKKQLTSSSNNHYYPKLFYSPYPYDVPNQPKKGYALLWTNNTAVNYYGSPNLQWNVPPFFVEYPYNQTYVTKNQPTCNLTIRGIKPMNVYFYENTTGSWVLRQINSSVGNGTYRWPYTQASTYGNKYWWKVAVDDGTTNISRVYWFTVLSGFISSAGITTATANSNRKAVCRSYDGTLYAVYLKQDSTGKQNIYFAKSTDGGLSWTEKSLTSYTGYNAGSPTIACDSTGKLHLIYPCQSNSGTWYLYYRNSSDSGTTWTSGVDIGVGNYQQNVPCLALDSLDNLHVVWKYYISGSDSGIRYRKFSKSGGWGTSIEVSSPAYSIINDPSIAIDKNNHVHVAWMGGSYWTAILYYRYFDGTYWEDQRNVYDSSGNQGWCPNIVIDSNNKISIAWIGQSYNYQGILYYDTSSDLGNTWTHTWIAGTTVQSCSLSVDSNSNYLYLVYASLDANNILQLYFQKYTTSWSSAVKITSTPSYSGCSYNHGWPELLYQGYPYVKKTNVPTAGYSFIWTDRINVKYYKSADLAWSTPPFNVESPLNTTILTIAKPTCVISAYGTKPFTIYWYENSTGSWVLRQTNSSVSNGTYRWSYTQASHYDKRYWWKVAVDDGTTNYTRVLYFNTPPFQSNPYPPDGATSDGILTTPKCTITATHPEGKPMNVYFYDSSGTILTTAGTSVASVYGVNWYGESFKPKIGVAGVSLYAKRVGSGSPGSVTVSIRATDGAGKPTGADLIAATDATAPYWSTSFAWHNFTFTSVLPTTSGTLYATVVRAPSGTSSNYIGWAYAADNYADGAYQSSTNSGSTWATPSTTNDFSMRINDFVLRQTNSSVSNGIYRWTDPQATTYDTTYWWKVSINDTTDNTSRYYSFITRWEYFIAHTNYSLSFADSSRKSICRSPTGTVYAVYLKLATKYNVFLAKSTDDGITWTEKQITSYTTYDQGVPTIAIDSSGALHIVYPCRVNGGTYYLYYQKSTDNGVTWSTPLDIGVGNYAQTGPCIAVDGLDNLHVVWKSANGGTIGMIYRKYTKSTSTWEAIFQLTTDTYMPGTNPCVVIDKDNHVHTAWASSTSTYARYVYYRYYNGVSWEAIRLVYDPGGGENQQYVNMVVDSNNKIHIVWLRGSSNFIYWTYSTNYGVSWATPTQIVSGDSTTVPINPSIATDRSNNLHFLWTEKVNSVYQIMYEKYTGSWSTKTQIISSSNSHLYPSLLWAQYPSTLNASRPKTGYAAIWTNEINTDHPTWLPSSPSPWDLYYRKSSDLTFDMAPPVLTLVSPANKTLLERQSWGNLTINISGFGTANVKFYNATGNYLMKTWTGVGSGKYYYNWTGLSPNVRKYWYVIINGTAANQKSSTWNFITDDIPRVKNFRIDTINEDNITVAWQNEPDMAWISLKIGSSFMEVRKILGFAQSWYVGSLFKDSQYNLEWQLGDNATAMSNYNNFDFRTYGWKPDLKNFTYRKLITIDHTAVGSDKEGYAFNLTLTDDSFRYASGPNWWNPTYPAFLHLNLTSHKDIRFVNYYNMKYLPWNITYWNVPGTGGISTQVLPNESYWTGDFINGSWAHDGDWYSHTTPVPYGVLYYNYTIPAGAKTSSTFRSYQGEWLYDITLPVGCYGGSKLRFKSVCDYDTPYIDTYCWNYSSSNWVDIGNSTSRYFYETQMNWEFTAVVRIRVVPEHFNDSTASNVPGIDSGYDTKFWMYYGNPTTTVTNQTTFSNSLYTGAASIGSEEEYVVYPPVISNIVESNKTATSINISWATNEIADGRIKYATNPWLFGSKWTYRLLNTSEEFDHLYGNQSNLVKLKVYSPQYISTISVVCSNPAYNSKYSVNSSTGEHPVAVTFQKCNTTSYLNWTITYRYNKTIDRDTYAPQFMMNNLATNTTYYYQILAHGEGGNTTSNGDFTLGTLPSTPHAKIKNYDENRPAHQVTVWGNLTSMNGNPSINCSIQYWNESSTNFSETSVTHMTTTGLFNKTISVDYGHMYYYRVKASDTTIGYSDVYSNYFMPIQAFFAGDYVEDNNDNGANPDFRSRQYLPPNPNGTVNLSAKAYEQTGYWEGSLQTENWMWVETNITTKGTLTLHLYTKEYGHVGDYVLTNDTDSSMRYVKLTGLNSSFYTFYITGAGGQMVLNWTKPSLIHKVHQSRVDESKYVSFSATPSPVNYTLLYMDTHFTNTSAYEWSQASGLDLYSAMGVEYFGGGYETGVTPQHSGTAYDRGQLFRGGVWDGEPNDTGTLEPTMNNKPMGANRFCFAFTDYDWNLSQLPSNNITNYYFRHWSTNSHWSTYLGYYQNREFHYDYLYQFKYDLISYTRDWKPIANTTIYTEKDVDNVSGSVFNTGAITQSLQVGYKNGFNFDPSNDNIWNFGFYTDGLWTNQQIGAHQQGYVIFNLPSNATLMGMDSDHDGLNDYQELFVYYTNPKCNDTDGDGQPDGFEVAHGHDPNVYTDKVNPPTILITNPTNTTYVSKNGVVNITVSISDPDSGYSYNISICKYPSGDFVHHVLSGVNTSFIETSWTPAGITQGYYAVKVTATDIYSYQSTSLQQFYLTGFYVSNPSIPNGQTGVPTSVTTWSLNIEHNSGLFNWTIQTSPNIGNSYGNNAGNGTKSCTLTGLANNTIYHVYINTTGSPTQHYTYWFETGGGNQTLAVNITPSTWNIGVVLLGESAETTNYFYTLTNLGITCNIDIKFNDSENWAASLFSGIGHDKFAMNFSKNNWGSQTNINPTSGTSLATNIPYFGNSEFDLKVLTPTTSSTLSTQHYTITFIVTPS